MQTFMPCPDFRSSVAVLDPKRLGNQVYREGVTLLRGGWPNHPASLMWRGYKPALAAYLRAGLYELKARDHDYLDRPWAIEILELASEKELPPWMGWEEFHASHRSNLLRKDPEWYKFFGWTEPPTLEYIWPSVGKV